MKTLKDKKAWKILDNDEQLSLMLSKGQGKSSWEVSEIIKKAHYKSLEITTRAERFLVMFKEHYDLFPDVDLFPERVRIPSDFKEYFERLILKREKPSAIYHLLSNPEIARGSYRREKLINLFERWESSKRGEEQHMFKIIKEFDRFNNFRILPLMLQEPHAFKRRRKKQILAVVSRGMKLTKARAEEVDKLKYTGVKQKFFTYIVWDIENSDYEVISIQDTPSNWEVVNKYYLYAFNSYLSAKSFIDLCMTYAGKDIKHVKDGQIFWPVFRERVARATNFNEIHNISKLKPYTPVAQRDDDKRILAHLKKTGKYPIN